MKKAGRFVPLLVAVTLALGGPIPAPVAAQNQSSDGARVYPREVRTKAPRDGRRTHATWYTGSFGACGKALNGNYAASKKYACGAKVKVTHHGKSVVVTILDRCQCMMDMAKRAFRKLANPSKGVIAVRLYKRR